MGVREPGTNRYCMLRMEDVRGRGVVNDDGLFELTTDLRQVLVLLAENSG